MKSQHDRRGTERVQVNGELLLDINTHNFIKANTVNISTSGINFTSNAAIPLFRELEIKITLPKPRKNHNVDIIRCHAVVVRCENRKNNCFDISLFYINIHKQDKERIEEYVKIRAGPKVRV